VTREAGDPTCHSSFQAPLLLTCAMLISGVLDEALPKYSSMVTFSVLTTAPWGHTKQGTTRRVTPPLVPSP